VFTACRTMHAECYRPATSWGHYTTRCKHNHRPKHVELIKIINKPLLLHLVGCLHYLHEVPAPPINELRTLLLS
jgi:hypothetical protein